MIDDADAGSPAPLHRAASRALAEGFGRDEGPIRGGVQALERALAKVPAADRILCAL